MQSGIQDAPRAPSWAAPLPYVERLHRLRNAWRFAACAQFLHLFGSAFSQEEFFTEDLEEGLLSNYSPYLVELAVKMLRVMTQNRFITAESWCEYLRREYIRRDPSLNPFAPRADDARWMKKRGIVVPQQQKIFTDDESNDESDEGTSRRRRKAAVGETQDDVDMTEEEAQHAAEVPTNEGQTDGEPASFWALSDELRLNAFHRMCEWQMDNPERFIKAVRPQSDEKLEDWRVVPTGYDRYGRVYWLFDDNRLYREWPIEDRMRERFEKLAKARQRRLDRLSAKKAKPGKTKAAKPEREPSPEPDADALLAQRPEGSWELLCRTVSEWEQFCTEFTAIKSTDSDEKYFQEVLKADLLPAVIPELKQLEKRRKQAGAAQAAAQLIKRSSRIAVRELEMQQRRIEEADRLREQGLPIPDELREALGEEYFGSQEAKIDAARSRAMRYEEREWRRATNLAVDASDSASEYPRRRDSRQNRYDEDTYSWRGSWAATRRSSRTTASQKTYAEPDEAEFEEEEGDWEFRCGCGIVAKNYSDGTQMLACDDCGVWQHLACVVAGDPWVKRYPDWENRPYYCAACRPKYEKGVATNDDSSAAELDNGKVVQANEGRKRPLSGESDEDAVFSPSVSAEETPASGSEMSWSEGERPSRGSGKKTPKKQRTVDSPPSMHASPPATTLRLVLKATAHAQP